MCMWRVLCPYSLACVGVAVFSCVYLGIAPLSSARENAESCYLHVRSVLSTQRRMCMCRVGQNHICTVYILYTVFLAGKSPNIRSYHMSICPYII